MTTAKIDMQSIRRMCERQRRFADAALWVAERYREGAKERGVQTVAKQMRKQGIPLDVAVSILATR